MNKLGQIKENRLILWTLWEAVLGRTLPQPLLKFYSFLSPETSSSGVLFPTAILPNHSHPKTTALSLLPPLPSNYIEDLEKKDIYFASFPWVYFVGRCFTTGEILL